MISIGLSEEMLNQGQLQLNDLPKTAQVNEFLTKLFEGERQILEVAQGAKGEQTQINQYLQNKFKDTV